jgi:hypothetical protein
VPGERFKLPIPNGLKSRPSVAVGVAVALLIIVVSLPVGLRKTPTASAPRDALALIDVLDARMSKPTDDARAGSLGVDRPARRVLRRDIFSPEALHPKARSQPQEMAPRARPEPARDPGPELMGIFVDGHSKQAVISGHRVAEGDSVAGYWVIEITRESILLWNDGGFKTLTLEGDR